MRGRGIAGDRRRRAAWRRRRGGRGWHCWASRPGRRAQEPEAPAQEAAGRGIGPPLSLRYRFIERYGVDEDAAQARSPGPVPGRLRSRRSGASSEQAQGAPQRQEITFRTIYTERPARIGRQGEVTDTVRRYDMFRAGGAAQADPRMAILLGLTLWYHLRAGAARG